MPRHKRLRITSEILLVISIYASVIYLWPESATIPATFDNAEWSQRVDELSHRVATQSADIVFLGDSLIQRWETAYPKSWQHYFGDHHAMNLGVSGECTQHVLWRLEHGTLAGLAKHPPKLIVLMIGSNNCKGIGNPPAETALGICEIVFQLRRSLPDAKIELLAILPCGSPDSRRRRQRMEASRLVARIADGRHIVFRDMSAIFLQPNGDLLSGITSDGVHLNGRGYELWGRALEPILRDDMQD